MQYFTPELILCDQDGHRDGPSMASAWQGPRADFAAHFPGGTQSAVPGTLASQDAVLATLWNPLPPGDRPLTYTMHYRLLGLFPKTETFSYTWDTGEGTVPEGPAGPLAALRALLAPLLPPGSELRDPDDGLEDLAGRRLLFAVALDEGGCNMAYYRMLSRLRRSTDLLEGSIGACIVTGVGEFYTKDVAREMYEIISE